MNITLPDIGSPVWLWAQLTVVEVIMLWQILSTKALLLDALERWERRFKTLGDDFVDALVGRVVGDGVLGTIKEGLGAWFGRKQAEADARVAAAKAKAQEAITIQPGAPTETEAQK